MKAQEIHLAEGSCSCLLEDPEQGPLRLDAVGLSTEQATLGESPRLTVAAYVDVTLEFTGGPRSQLFAQIVEKPVRRNGGDATASAAEHEANEEVEAEETGYVLRWIHSDPLGENRLGSLIQSYIDTGGQFEQKTREVEKRLPTPLGSILPEDGTAGVLIVPDQYAPAPVPSLDEATGEPRRSFRFRHLVEGPTGPRTVVRPPQEMVIRPPPRDSQAGGDGRYEDESDMSALLRQRAKMVRAADLAARHDRVRVLGESTLRQLLDEAVNEAVENVENSLGESERKRLLEEAEEAFRDRLEAFKAEKAGLESQAKVLQDQLDKAQKLLEEERQRVVSADQFTVSDAGMLEIESRLERMLHRAVKEHGVGADLEAEMRGVLSRLLDEERDRISAKAQEAQTSNIELLERKVQRLANSLEETTRERDTARRRAEALESAGGAGLRNIITAGLDDDDPNKKKKLGLLKEIYEQNKEMRAHLAERQEAERESTGNTAASWQDADARPVADTDIESEETEILSRTPTVVAQCSENTRS